MEGIKSLKEYAKEAKKRLKSSFWQEYKQKVEDESKRAEFDGTSKSKVVEYYQNKAKVSIRGVKTEDEGFYIKVKNILDTYGDVSDALGRLTDKLYYESLSYEAKQRYMLELSNKYRLAKERYYKEKKFEKTV
ncbi:MAG: hypothetical protein E7358_02890 [Clostridiales bacterium]|nr:hypothetical protein [Clostridiales bacterium]